MVTPQPGALADLRTQVEMLSRRVRALETNTRELAAPVPAGSINDVLHRVPELSFSRAWDELQQCAVLGRPLVKIKIRWKVLGAVVFETMVKTCEYRTVLPSLWLLGYRWLVAQS